MSVGVGTTFGVFCFFVCLSVRSIIQNRNDPKVFKVGIGNDRFLGLKGQRSKLVLCLELRYRNTA